MFTVGEFSRLAQVSKRLLRYYDEIDLLKPVHIDRWTGYRYYSAEQLVQLNRILALKDLGLSLEQVQRILKGSISSEDIQELLLGKKAEVEREIQGGFQRLRQIEARLQAMRSAEARRPANVILKQLPTQPILSLCMVVATFEAGLSIFDRIEAALPPQGVYGFRICICHDDDPVPCDMNLEMGYLLTTNAHEPLPLDGDLCLLYRELPAVNTMATFVVKGGLEYIHNGYAEIGMWAEINHYRLAGIPREIALQAPRRSDGSDLITEIQFPVEPIHHA